MNGMAKTYAALILTAVALILVSVMVKAETNPDIIDLNKVVTFETTDTGVMLIFKDGSGYYIEK